MCYASKVLLLAVDMVGVACRGLWCAYGWKNVKRYRDGSP